MSTLYESSLIEVSIKNNLQKISIWETALDSTKSSCPCTFSGVQMINLDQFMHFASQLLIFYAFQGSWISEEITDEFGQWEEHSSLRLVGVVVTNSCRVEHFTLWLLHLLSASPCVSLNESNRQSVPSTAQIGKSIAQGICTVVNGLNIN